MPTSAFFFSTRSRPQGGNSSHSGFVGDNTGVRTPEAALCEGGSGSYGNELKAETGTLTACKWIMGTLSRRGFRVVPLLCSIVVCCDWARAQDIIGVNAVNLAWQPAAVREIVLDEIAGSGIRDVRLSLIPPYEASLDVLRVAKALRLKVLLNIGLNVRLFYSSDVKPQPAGDGLNEAWPLSALDPARFAATMQPFWRQIVAEELPVRAVEVGNEINWADFNGDLRRHLAGQSDSPDSLEGLPERDAFRTGLDRYIALLRLIGEWRSESLAARRILIVSAGLATVSPEFARQMGLDVVTPADTLNVLRGEGLTAVADRIGIHVYANAGLSATASRTNLWSTLKPCVRMSRVGLRNGASRIRSQPARRRKNRSVPRLFWQLVKCLHECRPTACVSDISVQLGWSGSPLFSVALRSAHDGLGVMRC